MFAVDVRTGSTPTSSERLLASIDPFGQADRSGTWSAGGASIAQTILDLSSEHRARSLPTACATTDRRIAAWVRLDDRDALIGDLDAELQAVRGELAHPPTDPELVLAAHLRWGLDAPSRLIGDFSYAIVDPAGDHITIAVDPLAVRPCVFHVAAGRVAATTTVAAIQALDDIELSPSDRWLAQFVAGASSSLTETPYEDVHRLAGGEIAVLRPGAPVERRRYHEWVDDPPDTLRRDPGRVTSFRQRLVEAHRDRLRVEGPIGVESSGGLDSSTCVALSAREVGPDRIRVFGFVNLDAEPGLNEAVLNDAGVAEGHRHLVRPGDARRQAELDRIFTVLGHPAEHGNGPGHEEFYLRCRESGIRTLLSGFGGDEVATNPAPLFFEELLDRRRYLTLARNLYGPVWQRPARFVKIVAQRRRGRGRRHALQEVADAVIARLPLRAEVIESHRLAQRLRHMGRYTTPYRRINDWILDERMAAGFVSTRLRDCSLLAQSHGVEYSWPLWDRRVVQEYLSAPSIEKRGPGYGRYLHRRAVDGVVADEVTWRTTKATGDPIDPDARRHPDQQPIEFGRLHPRLAALLDPARTAALMRLSAAGGADGDRARRAARTLRGISALDRWLWFAHPDDR